MVPVMASQGLVGAQESALIVQATLLMLIVVIPVFGLLFFFAWWYRAGNANARYEPEWEHSAMDELVWWAVPLEIVLVLAALTWTSTHKLDPSRPLESQRTAVEVQVVALPWKWLFIYPQYDIATVQELYIPAETPISFSITAQAPMNSFWIPELGGQIYAMSGMRTPLQLLANRPGTYRGVSANYSGEGFSRMNFQVSALAPDAFEAWALQTQHRGGPTLTRAAYDELALPGTTTPQTFSTVDAGLFNAILTGIDAPHGARHTQ